MPHCVHCGKEIEAAGTDLFKVETLCETCRDEREKKLASATEEPEQRELVGKGGGLPGLCGPGKDGINFHR